MFVQIYIVCPVRGPRMSWEDLCKKMTPKLLKDSPSWKEVREFWDAPYKTPPNRGFDPFSGIRRGDRAPRAKHFSPRGELAFPRATRGFVFSRIEAVRRYTVADLANIEPKV